MIELDWKYVKPLQSEDAIKRFETDNQLVLPRDVVECFSVYNGGRPNRKLFDTEVSQERVLKSLLSLNENDRETIDIAMGVVKNEQSTLIPLASDPGGNYICYDTSSDSIVFWLHEINSIERVANSFNDFLDMLY